MKIYDNLSLDSVKLIVHINNLSNNRSLVRQKSVGSFQTLAEPKLAENENWINLI